MYDAILRAETYRRYGGVCHSTAGNWLFCFRRWRDPRDSEDLEALEREYASLCSAFPRFAASCSKDRFLACIVSVCAPWFAKIRDEPPTFSLQERGDTALSPRRSPTPPQLPPATPASSDADATQAVSEAADVAFEPDAPSGTPMPAISAVAYADEMFEDVSALWEPCSRWPGVGADTILDAEITDALRAADPPCFWEHAV